MKRFLSLRITLCLFLLGMVCNVAWAQPTVSPAPVDGQWAEGTTWYQVKTKSGYFLRGDFLDSDGYVKLPTTSVVDKAALWCIVGDETNGYAFYNKAVGVETPLGMTSNRAAFVAVGTSGYTSTFDFVSSQKTDAENTYWCIRKHTGADNTQYWNPQSSYLAIWNTSGATNDNGSAFMFTEYETMDVFSTDAAPKWYSIEFKTGGNSLTDKGNGNILVTAAAADSKEEYWMFIGDEWDFKMKSRLGNYVYFESDRFKTTNDATKAATLKFVAGSTADTWELQREGSDKCMNQNGGTGVGVQLGEWNKGDGNNPFYLREFKEMGVFSTEAAPKWYSVEFKTGGNFLTDKGNGNTLVTAGAADSDEEYWMFIGDEFGFKMKSRLGNYVYFADSRFKTTNEVANAATLYFVAGKTADTWELQREGSSSCMNQNGGTGVGVQLGEWTKGDGNNPFYLNEVEIIDHFIEPVFSDANNEHWFMIRFANGNAHLASNGANDQAVTANLRNVSSQWWKFVGTAENFQLVSKDGRYATLKNGTATNGQTGNLLHMVSEPDANGFSIIESANANYPDTYEIVWNGASGKSFNQWGGAGAGKSVGVWDTGDNNNPLFIYMPDPNLLSPFDIEGISSYTPASPLTLWYKNAASNMEVSDQWMEYSLPIGNGQFGASIFGGVAREEVQFNEKTLWSGTKNDNSSEYGDYENFGSLYIDDISEVFGEGKAVKNYYRQLDLSNATASVHYTSTDGTINFTREYISSNPDKVVAMRLTADAEEKISIKVTLKAGRPGLRATTSYADGKATFGGKLETITYNALAKVVPTGGTMTTTADGITVKDADEVLIILGGATDFDAHSASYVSGTEGLTTLVSERVDAAAEKGWNSLYADHVADHKTYFDRCNFVLDGAANNMPTDELIRQYANRTTGTEDYALMLEQLYFAYGRYLEIGSSRGVDLPANLQGIWNNSSEPAWNGDIHANINVQMNYWPAEPTNLSEMHMPFLNYIINMANSAEWKALAQKKGSTRPEAWTMLTENNIFGGFGAFAQNAVINNAWYVSHLWQHYRYTLDQAFLEKAFPAMWGASMFWVDRLELNETDGTYECPDEYSPEHGPGAENATAHSQQLVWELFDNTLKAVAILGESKVNADDLAILRDRFSKLDKGLATEVYDGQWGTSRIASGTNILREWKTSNYTAGADGHRHMSHLMCLYPFNQLTEGTDLFNAAINSMLLRGDASTGWSMGWKINLWARALDGDHSHDILELALRHHSVSGGGVYYNLYDSHAPFQIDGNFGACAGIAEMLMQSHTEVIDILPALPSVWQKGSITGLKAVGNFTVSLNWEEGKAQQVTIVSHKGAPLKVRCNHGAVALADAKITVNGAVVAVEMENGIATIPCAEGQTVVVDFTQASAEESVAEYIVNMTTGTFAGSGNYRSSWTYTTTKTNPAALTLSSDASNMNSHEGLIQLHSGTAGESTYTLTVPAGYTIVSYSFGYAFGNSGTGDKKFVIGGTEYFVSAESQSLKVEDVNAKTTTFVLSGENKPVKLSNFIVRVKANFKTLPLATEVEGSWENNPNTLFGDVRANDIATKLKKVEGLTNVVYDYTQPTTVTFARPYRGFEFQGFYLGEQELGKSFELTDALKTSITEANPIIAKFTATSDVTLFYDDDTYSYRIPAITTTGTGRIVAVSDYRHNLDDIGRDNHSTGTKRIDLVMRYSDNNGETWSETQTIAAGDNSQTGSYLRAFGDAAIAAVGQNIIVMAAAGDQLYPSATTASPNRMARIFSSDNGVTWTKSEMTSKMYNSPESLIPNGVAAFFGSGKLVVDANYNDTQKARIYGALLVRTYIDGNYDNYNNYVVYSDDLGETWAILGGSQTPIAKGDEPKVEILPNGQILLSARRGGGRIFNVFTYTDKANNAGTWDTAANGCGNGGSNATNGEIFCIDAKKVDGTAVKLLMQSQPKGGGNQYDRKDVTIWYKEIDANTTYTTATIKDNWTEGLQVSSQQSSYSAVTMQPNGKIALFFEEAPCYADDYTKGYSMVYVPLTIESITKGNYFSKGTDLEAATTIDVTLTDEEGNTYKDLLTECKVGEVATKLQEKYPFITLGDNASLTYDGTAYTYSNTLRLPFRVSNSETTVWHNIYFLSNKINQVNYPVYLSASNSDDEFVATCKDNVAGEYGDNSFNTLEHADKISWAVYQSGNGFAFKFKNKLTGKFVQTTSVATGNSKNVKYVNDADATVFELIPTSNNFYAVKANVGGTDGYLCCTSAGYGFATHFSRYNHAGGTLTFAEVSNFETLIAEVNNVLSLIGTGLGKYTVTDANAETVVEAKGAMQNSNTVKLNDLIAYRDLLSGANLNKPQNGQYFRVAYDYGGNVGKLYMQGVASSVKGVQFTAEDGDPSVWVYYNGGLYSYYAGKYLREHGNDRGLQDTKTTVEFSESSRAKGKYNVKVGSFVHANSSNSNYFTDHCDKDGGHGEHDLILEEAEVNLNCNIGEYKIGTFYANGAMKIPEGVAAYVATTEPEMDGNVGVITMTLIEDIIPAHTGVIVKSEPDTYTFKSVTTNEETVADNLMVGYAGPNAKEAVTLDGVHSYYILTVVDGNAGFYKKSYNFNVSNNKAYLKVPANVAASIRLRFVNNNGTTEIIEVPTEALNTNGAIYDLSGRRVEKVEKGVYIVNGKKVIF